MTFTVSRDSCRICLELKSAMKPMITTYWKEIPYCEIFQQCTGFTLKLSEISPVNVCNDCELRLIEFYKFKKKCCATEHILEKFLELDDYKPLSSMNNNVDLSLEVTKRLITENMSQLERNDPIIPTNIKVSEKNLHPQGNEPVKNRTKMRTRVSPYKHKPKLKNTSLRNVKYKRKYVLNKNISPNMQEDKNELLNHKNIVQDERQCSTLSEQDNIAQNIFSSPTHGIDIEKKTLSPCKQISTNMCELPLVPENNILLKNIENIDNSRENSSVDTVKKVIDIIADKIITCNSINVQISDNNANVEDNLLENAADVESPVSVFISEECVQNDIYTVPNNSMREPPVSAVISDECVQNEKHTVESANIGLSHSMEANRISSTILEDPIHNNSVREPPVSAVISEEFVQNEIYTHESANIGLSVSMEVNEICPTILVDSTPNNSLREPPVSVVISEECVQNEIHTVDSDNMELSLSMEANRTCPTILEDPIPNNSVREVLPPYTNDDNSITKKTETTTIVDNNSVREILPPYTNDDNSLIKKMETTTIVDNNSVGKGLPASSNDDNLVTKEMDTITRVDSSLLLVCPEAQNTFPCSNEDSIRNPNEILGIKKTHTKSICDEENTSSKTNVYLSKNIIQKVHDKNPVKITPDVGYSNDLDKEIIRKQPLTLNQFLNSSHSKGKTVENKAKELITLESKSELKIALVEKSKIKNTDSVKKLFSPSKKINPVVSGIVETNNLKQNDNQKKRTEKISSKKLTPSKIMKHKEASNFVITEKIVSADSIETADEHSCKRSGKSDAAQTPNKKIKLDNEKKNSILNSNYPKIILEKIDPYCNFGMKEFGSKNVPVKKNVLQLPSDPQADQANSKDVPSTPKTKPRRSSPIYIETIFPTQRSTPHLSNPLIQNYKPKIPTPTITSSLLSNTSTYFSSDIDYEKELDNFCVNKIKKPGYNNEIVVSTKSDTANSNTSKSCTPSVTSLDNSGKLKHKTKASMKIFDIQNIKVVNKLKNNKANKKVENVKIISKLNLPKINTIKNCTATPPTTTTLSPIDEYNQKLPSHILYSPNIIENSVVSSHPTTGESFGTQEHDYERKTYDENYKQCTFCDAIFETKLELDDHMELHETQILYSCNLCSCSFSSMEDFENHKDICAPFMIEEKPHLCILCHETFTSEDDLNNHTQSHIDIRDMDDDVADYSFGYVNYN